MLKLLRKPQQTLESTKKYETPVAWCSSSPLREKGIARAEESGADGDVAVKGRRRKLSHSPTAMLVRALPLSFSVSCSHSLSVRPFGSSMTSVTTPNPKRKSQESWLQRQ